MIFSHTDRNKRAAILLPRHADIKHHINPGKDVTWFHINLRQKYNWACATVNTMDYWAPAVHIVICTCPRHDMRQVLDIRPKTGSLVLVIDQIQKLCDEAILFFLFFTFVNKIIELWCTCRRNTVYRHAFCIICQTKVFRKTVLMQRKNKLSKISD